VPIPNIPNDFFGSSGSIPLPTSSTVKKVDQRRVSPIKVRNPKESLNIQTQVTETINALQTNGSLEKILITGQISVTVPQTIPLESTHLNFKISNFCHLAAVKCNDTYVSISNIEGEYIVALDSLRGLEKSEVVLMKYQMKTDSENQNDYLPVLIKPVWKINELECQLLLAYQFNAKISTFKPANIKIHSVIEGCVLSVESVPECSAIDSAGMTWDLNLDANTDYEICKIKARVKTESTGVPHPLVVAFQANGCLLSGIELMADCVVNGVKGHEKFVFEIQKVVSAGHYVASGSLI
jgi:hypothetical protein